VSVLRDAALVLLALEGAALTLVVAASLAVLNYALLRLRWWHRVPSWFALAWRYVRIGQRVIAQMCQAVTAPVVAARAAQAAFARSVRGVLGFYE